VAHAALLSAAAPVRAMRYNLSLVPDSDMFCRAGIGGLQCGMPNKPPCLFDSSDNT
jgi:hypothetical protein